MRESEDGSAPVAPDCDDKESEIGDKSQGTGRAAVSPNFHQTQTFNFHISPVGSAQPHNGAVEQEDGSILLTGEQAEQWRRLANLPNDSAKSLMEAKLGEGENIADEVQIAQLFRQAVDKAERGDSELNPVGGKHVATAIKDWVRKEWARLKGQII